MNGINELLKAEVDQVIDTVIRNQNVVFLNAIRQARETAPSAEDALNALEAVYRQRIKEDDAR